MTDAVLDYTTAVLDATAQVSCTAHLSVHVMDDQLAVLYVVNLKQVSLIGVGDCSRAQRCRRLVLHVVYTCANSATYSVTPVRTVA
jgi:hypothetical protein